MSTTFEARFSTTKLTRSELLTRLGGLMGDHGLKFSGAFAPLRAHRGWPTVVGIEFAEAPSMTEVADAAKGWWGVGIECFSAPVFAILRSSAAEVYFNVFPTASGLWTLSYLEDDAVTDYRAEQEEGALALISLQRTICAACGLELSIYDEQSHARPPAPTLREVETAVRRCGQDGSRGDLCAVVSAKALSLEQAWQWAGDRAAEVQRTTDGFIVFPFLRARVR